jgi:hypothetical protein
MAGQADPAPSKLCSVPLPDLLALAALPPTAAALVAGLPDAPAALAALRAAGEFAAAARLAAHALPRREAVWWACMCAGAVPAPDVAEDDRKALEGAMAWVYRPSDEGRRAAFAHAQAAGLRTPEAWAGVAAFWSDGSMAPADRPAVPPPPHLAGTAVAGAVALAAVRNQPERSAARYARFLDSAVEIATGGSGRMAAEEA